MDKLLTTIVCLGTLAAFSSATTIGCDPGWEINGKFCYLFVTDKKVSYRNAEVECDKYDSSLLYITSKAEYSFYQTTAKTYGSAAYWTSLNDMSKMGSVTAPGTTYWKWGMNSLADINLIQWNVSPANDGVNNCGGVNIMGNMNDVDCNSKQGYICNIEIKAAGGGCPLGWLPTDTDCYYVSNTSDISQRLTWQQAKAKCVALNAGSHLITIDDVHDQSFLQSELPYLTKDTYLYWTGLQYSNGQWKWFNGATFNQKLFTWASEPDYVATKENCGVIRYNGNFSDRNCNFQYNFICKKPQAATDNILNNGCGIWLRAGQMCYMFYSNPRMTWSQAQGMCQSINGNLMNVKDLDTRAWLKVQMFESDTWAYWTALNDVSNEGHYVWSDGSALDTSTIYWNMEPNGFYGSEDCANIYPSGTFNDQDCTKGAAALCEVDNVAACPALQGGLRWVTRNADKGSGFNCYLFGNYSTYNNLLTYSEALSYCAGLAADANHIPTLLAVETAAEMSFIQTQLKGHRDNPWGYWTMMTDKGQDGFWSWGGKQLVDFKNIVKWDKEPRADTPDTDCAMVAYGANFFMKKCSTKMGFICERPANLGSNSGESMVRRFTFLPLLLSVLYFIV